MVDVKICGVCRAEDARAAADAGAAFVGVILAPGRGRSRTVAEAGAIFGTLDVRRVGVFVDAPAEVVIDAARALSLDAVQLHGNEPVELVRLIRDSVQAEVWKALRVRDATDLARRADVYAHEVGALLLDGWSPASDGGAGVRFDWDGASAAGVPAGVRLIVAGGLTPENVASAVALFQPAIVDVSSGVEDAPGRKSAARIQAFVDAARGSTRPAARGLQSDGR